jgi:hypothetical protein
MAYSRASQEHLSSERERDAATLLADLNIALRGAIVDTVFTAADKPPSAASYQSAPVLCVISLERPPEGFGPIRYVLFAP